MIKNLGQVAGIYIGNVAPSNTTIIWCNPTILPYSFKVWGGISWVDLATQEWVKITIGGYLISLPAKTIANDNDYLIINDGTNDNKIKVVDFVRSAVGNPLDFKGVIRVAADFPAPATLEGGDMYIIITSPSGGTVTDPYSGKTFKDTEKIVWDSVTNSWESLGLVRIEVNLGVDTKEDSVIITNTAGSSATIPTASASKAGVMSSQLLQWLTNLINGTTVLAAPDPSNPNIPAHKHNYSDLVNYPAIYQTLGQSTEGVMSQKAVTDTFAQYLPLSAGSGKSLTGNLYTNSKIVTGYYNGSGSPRSGYYSKDANGNEQFVLFIDNTGVVLGNNTLPVMIRTSPGADVNHYISGERSYRMWDEKNLPNPAKISDLAAYLLLSGGIMTGGVTFNNNIGLSWKNTAGSVLQQAYFNNNNVFVIGNTSNSQLVLRTGNTDVLRDRNGDSYKIWDSYNLPNPAGSTDLDGYLPLTAGATKPLTGQLFANQGVNLPFNVALRATNEAGDLKNVIYSMTNNKLVVGDASYDMLIASTASDLIHRRGASAEYKIWDAYNLSSPAKTSDLANYIPRAAENNAASLLTKPGGIYRQGASVDGEFGYSCNMLLRFDSGGTNWYTGGILSISAGGELRVAGVSNGALSVWRNMAVQGMANNFLYNGNEVTFISQTKALPGVWLNYRGCAGGITDYLLGSGKADGSYANLKVKNLYTSESIYIPNGQKLKSYSSEGNIVDMAYVAPGSNTLVLGHLSIPGVLIRSTNTDIYHTRNIGGTATNYKIWDAYNLSSPVTGSGGVAGQLAKWSAGTTLSGGIAYASANTAAALVARDGNGAFSASTVTATNANITNLNPGGENCVVQSGLIPRATSTCFLGSASRIFQNIYGNNIYVGVTLLPVTTATVNIGAANLAYKSGYIQTIHTGGVLPLTTASSVGSSANPFSSMFATTFNGSATKWNGLSQQVVSSLPSTLTPNTMYFVTA